MSHPAPARARRAGGLAVLTLGAFTLGAPATALAAPADETPDTGGTSLPEAEPVTGEVLTPVPLPATTDTDTGTDGAHFGWGKLEPDVVLAPGNSLPAGAVLDRTGAEIRVSYTRIWGDDTSDPGLFPDGPPVLECTWVETDADGNPCDFTGDAAVVDDEGRARLYPDSRFTVELIAAPTSGQVLLPAAPGDTILGYTDWDFEGPVSAVFEAPGASRATVPSDTSASVPLPEALPTVPAAPASVTPAPSSAPAPAPATPADATPAASTPEPVASAPEPSGAGGELADTGAEPLPIAVLGAGLVLAGGAVTVAATRRRTR